MSKAVTLDFTAPGRCDLEGGYLMKTLARYNLDPNPNPNPDANTNLLTTPPHHHTTAPPPLTQVMAVKVVENVGDAAQHINDHSSHHTDCIVAADAAAVDYFMRHIDSAGVYANASTRFADGQRYGFGAEVGGLVTVTQCLVLSA